MLAYLKLHMKQLITVTMDIILGILALLMVISMIRQLFVLGGHVLSANHELSFATTIRGSLSFFMYFEFTMMIRKYIDEDHHIPIRYLVYIAITAILRQEMVIHDDAVQTLILSVSIFLLVLTLIALQFSEYRIPFLNHRHEADEIKRK
ncbi:phosphate-starvation-inducible protein PsiE [Agrilactobacillus fermenti]|uniref:phosphate-starvation-inducible protein PsiE n=1 Tax=Agrilactobacillus fermenti TaxID=2586909 RepID=UPI001E58E0E6|nr:phosphate-starvation-inducible protein PsiE [Agrilactobacillus fermenti]MCD2255730.1 phosphate-starvation-inducible protein PsiE [Agrilactobacillus fermenti]